MKNYDSSVSLKKLKYDLDYAYEEPAKDILERRWKRIEAVLKKIIPPINKIFVSIGDQAVSVLSEIDYDYTKMNKNVSDRVKRLVKAKIRRWKDENIKNEYLSFLIATHTWTYKSVLKLLLCGIYCEEYSKIKEISTDVFVIASVDSYAQAIQESGRREFKPLSMEAIIGFAVMPVFVNTYYEYLDGLIISQEEEMESFLINASMSGKLSEDGLNVVLQKQVNRIIKVNNDKYSGGLDDAIRVVSNNAYLYDPPKDAQVKFIAEMDDRTTKMCQSLNGQLFYVNKKNTFRRYSASAQNVISVTCDGLVQGLNLPPVSDHFHWCRSTITYTA